MSTVHGDAANLIETQGWNQGGYYPGWTDTRDAPNGHEAAVLINKQGFPCCVVGALYACGARPVDVEALAAHLLAGTGAVLPVAEKAEEVVVVWNDAASTTQADVVDALRKVGAR